MKILFVEDQKELRDILEKRLKKEYSVDACGDGETALDFLSVYSYDLVLLDIMLPKMDGMSVLKWMRRRNISTPVLLLTAKSDIKDRVRGLDSAPTIIWSSLFLMRNCWRGSGYWSEEIQASLPRF